MLTETLKDLRDLRLGAMAACLQEWMDQPANHDRPSLECVEALVLAQKQDAADHRVQRFFREADLPMVCVADVRPSAQRGLPPRLLSQLVTCDWVRQGHQVVITGPSGAGKTFVASALGREAMLLKLGVTYWHTQDLLDRLSETPAGTTRAKLFRSLSRVPLLILDHFAGQKTTAAQGYDLLKVLDSRRRHGKATLVASPNHFQDWETYFEDATTADAVCSRLAEKVQVIELKPPKPPTRSP
jgi:DNA replication protein DnaC